MAATSAPVQIPLASLKALSRQASDERLINVYPEQVGKGDGARAVLYGAAGLTSFNTSSMSTSRGLLEVDTVLIAVNGADVYGISTTGGGTFYGAIPGTLPVRMSRNAALVPQTLVVADGGLVYKSEAGAITAVAGMLGTAVDVEWIDGFFIVALADGRFQYSAINNTTFAPLDFATAEANPDGLVGVKKLREEVFFFGSETIQVFNNTGDNANPFQPLPGVVIQSGCSSRDSIQRLDERLYWLDETGIVKRTSQGYAAETVADQRGVYDAVRAVSDKSTIRAFTYKLGSHRHYVLTAPSFTWVYDESLDLWHERVSKNANCWQACTQAFFAGRNIVGSTLSGTIFYIDEQSYAEGADEIIGTIRFPRIDSFDQGGTISILDFDMENGVGIASSSDSDTVDPHMTIRWSKDGAKTWQGGRQYTLGKQGEYRHRVRGTRFGAFGTQGLVLEVTISSKIFKALINVNMWAEELDR